MADWYVVGDTPRLGNTFKVAGVATDPTTVALSVTDPSGNTDTYTWAGGGVTRSSVGVFYKDVTVDEDARWEFLWVGTGTAADEVTGSLEVHPADTDDTDVLTVVDAQAALDIAQTDTTKLGQLREQIAAVSALLDGCCGPIRTRTITALRLDGGNPTINLPNWPLYSIGSLADYSGTTGTTLTAETAGVIPNEGYLLTPRTAGTGNYTGVIRRRKSGWDSCFASTGVLVTYIAGRYPKTEVVHSKFKVAAVELLKHHWRQNEISVGNVGDFEIPYQTYPSGFGVPKAVRDILGDDWLGETDRMLAGPGFA